MIKIQKIIYFMLKGRLDCIVVGFSFKILKN